MLPDSVSWARGLDKPLLVFKPDTEGGHFEGVLGTSPIVGDQLAIDGFTAAEASAVLGGDTETFNARVSACAERAGMFVLNGCSASILKGKLRATRISGVEITEVND
jgi:hypothetical protein